MSAHINTNILKSFIVKTIGADKLAHDRAQGLGINNDKFDKANENDNNYLELDEILDNKDLYEQFATMFVEEQKEADEKDAEKEKEEKNKVKDKNGAASA